MDKKMSRSDLLYRKPGLHPFGLNPKDIARAKVLDQSDQFLYVSKFRSFHLLSL